MHTCHHHQSQSRTIFFLLLSQVRTPIHCTFSSNISNICIVLFSVCCCCWLFFSLLSLTQRVVVVCCFRFFYSAPTNVFTSIFAPQFFLCVPSMYIFFCTSSFCVCIFVLLMPFFFHAVIICARCLLSCLPTTFSPPHTSFLPNKC